jgi:hypothetical protein
VKPFDYDFRLYQTPKIKNKRFLKDISSRKIIEH